MALRHGVSIAVVFGIVGALIGAVVAVEGLGPAPTKSPGVIRFEGVNLTISYSGKGQGAFGPTDQNACNQTLPHFVLPGTGPDCPAKLTGGGQYFFEVFSLWAAQNASFTFVNVSLHSPLPILSVICTYQSANPVPSLNWNLTQEFPLGHGCDWGVQIQVPNPAPSIPGGLWLEANMTVHGI